jgi:hypothetical protein
MLTSMLPVAVEPLSLATLERRLHDGPIDVKGHLPEFEHFAQQACETLRSFHVFTLELRGLIEELADAAAEPK